MNIKNLLLILLGLSLNAISHASGITISPTIVEVPTKKAFIPVGFDNNDKVQVMVTGVFPDSCYRIGPYVKDIDETHKTISIRQLAYLYKKNCLPVVVPFAQVIDLQILYKNGDYSITDPISGKKLGLISIAKAKHPDEADDFLYAPITDASVTEEEGKHFLNLNIEFSSRCMRLKEVKTKVFEDTIVVQPISEWIGKDRACEPEEHRFTYREEIKEELSGLKLLHVRSVSGQAINKLVNLDPVTE